MKMETDVLDSCLSGRTVRDASANSASVLQADKQSRTHPKSSQLSCMIDTIFDTVGTACLSSTHTYPSRMGCHTNVPIDSSLSCHDHKRSLESTLDSVNKMIRVIGQWLSGICPLLQCLVTWNNTIRGGVQEVAPRLGQRKVVTRSDLQADNDI